MNLHLIVPCYKPESGWPTQLTARFHAFSEAVSQRFETRLWVVLDGGSPDSEGVAELKPLVPGVQIIAYPDNKGKGYALRAGVGAAPGPYYLVTDIDFPYTLDSMSRVCDTLARQGGVVAGNRDQAYYAHTPVARKRISKILRWIVRRIFRLSVDDTQCGLKAFDQNGKEAFMAVNTRRFLYDLEFLLLAQKAGVPVTSVAVTLREGIIFSKVSLKVLLQESRNLLRLFFMR